MLDRYLTGVVSRISPEAPVPVLEWGSEEDRLGGAANVVLNVAALGGEAYLCGLVGDDAEGRAVAKALDQFKLPTDGLVVSPDRMTTVKTRILAGPQQLLRLDKEHAFDLGPEEEARFLHRTLELMNAVDFDVLVFQDYNKGVLTPDVIARLIQEAKNRSIPMAVDPKFKNFWAYTGVDLFKPNLKEVRDVVGGGVQPSKDSLVEASRVIRQRLGNALTVITLSDKGIFMDNGLEAEVHPPVSPRKVADVCGAGDTVISVAAMSLAAGLLPHDIALLANLAGGQVVEKIGVVPVDREQLMKEAENFRHNRKSRA